MTAKQKHKKVVTISPSLLAKLKADRKRLQFVLEDTICYQYVDGRCIDVNSRKDIDYLMEHEP